MSSLISQQWQERTSGFFSSSGTKLREARQTAGSFVGEVAKDAKVNVADVAERVGSLFKSRWAILQQPATRHAVQEHLITAAATTGTLVRKGITETKEKVSVGKIKVEEAAKKTAQKSKTLLTDIERWQKGVASSDVFGVAIEITVQRQESNRPIPSILMKCADYLILTGLNSPNLFKTEGDKKLIQQLVSAYNQDPSASIPEGVNPLDVAALMKYYLASLPTPLTTFELYNEIKDARSSVARLRKSLQKLSSVNYNTLEFITALLLRVSEKAQLNKMDSHSLAMEMAPVIMWKEEKRPESYREYWRRPSRSPKKSIDFETASPWDLLSDEGEGVDASSSISLADVVQVDFGAVDVVQCLIEHHNAIFTDAGETVWR
ncbi:putative Rho GTPase-activating protein [Hirschfeldia incana]|nr:putative Rho GTPase-activating protein [Hirschfeldia incana]